MDSSRPLVRSRSRLPLRTSACSASSPSCASHSSSILKLRILRLLLRKCSPPVPGPPHSLSTLAWLLPRLGEGLWLPPCTDAELRRKLRFIVCIVEKSQLLAEGWLAMLAWRLRSWRSARGGRPARSVPTRYRLGCLAVRKKGSARSRSAVGRAVGSLQRHIATTSANAREYLYLPPVRSSVGGSLFKILASTRAGGSRECGARPCASSSAVIPRLQMSADESYCFWLITSGAIQHGVPTKLFRLPNSGGGAEGEGEDE